MTTINRLICALTEAQADPTEEAVTRCLGMARAMRAEAQGPLVALVAGQQHDGPQLAREEIADALAMADAAAVEAKEDIEEVYRRGEAQGRADHAALTAAEVGHLRLRLAAAERVRRGARCLRERCRRLEARARMAEQAYKAHIDAACERGRRIREALIGAGYDKRE